MLHWGKVYNIPVKGYLMHMERELEQMRIMDQFLVFFFNQKIKNKPLTVVGDGKQERDFVYIPDVANAFT